LGVGTLAIFLGLYNLVALFPLGPPVDLLTPLDRAIPFLPWTWWLYVPAYGGSMFHALFSLRDVQILLRTLAALVVCQLVNDVFYLAMPAPFPRPADPGGDGLTAAAFRVLWAIDPPGNTFPSSHVAVAFVAWRCLRLDGHPRAWVNGLALVSIFLTVHTTKQHFVVDSLAGVAMGWACHRLLLPRRPRPAAPNPVASSAGLAHDPGPGGA